MQQLWLSMNAIPGARVALPHSLTRLICSARMLPHIVTSNLYEHNNVTQVAASSSPKIRSTLPPSPRHRCIAVTLSSQLVVGYNRVFFVARPNVKERGGVGVMVVDLFLVCTACQSGGLFLPSVITITHTHRREAAKPGARGEGSVCERV